VLFGKKGADPEFPRGDQGSGSLDDYKFDLLPAKRDTVIRLAGSDPAQDLIAQAREGEQITTAIPRRTAEDERVDAEMPVRLFVDGRIVGPVGRVPRGLEAVVNEALSRMEIAGRKARIPVEIVSTRQGLRVELQMGETR
jgi:hypothetical protein